MSSSRPVPSSDHEAREVQKGAAHAEGTPQDEPSRDAVQRDPVPPTSSRETETNPEAPAPEVASREEAAAPRSPLVAVAPPAPTPKTLRRHPWLRYALVLLLVLLALPWAVGFYWGREPRPFDIYRHTQAAVRDIRPGQADAVQRPGVILTATLIGIAERLLEKPGGYISNDVSPPGVWMDNIQAWEFGVLTALRDTVRALRDDFSRSQSQSAENLQLQRADAQFHFDHRHWVLPATEDEYRQGIAGLERYLADLVAPTSESGRVFFARTDNLIAYLGVVERRLGSLAQRLSANVDDIHFSADPLMEEDVQSVEIEPALRNAQDGRAIDYHRDIEQRTSWWDVDRVFYEARGYVWALSHLLRAIERDFEGIFAGKNAQLPLRRIVAKLDSTQRPVWSPTIFNHSGFGIFTNHSLVMASYISRANAALIDLRLLLMQG
ncbi:MAG: DUF2333 family protein [Candidatus Competibacterales bacterium]